MPSDSDRPTGWTIWEALRRTVDPDLMTEVVATQRTWREVGRPTVFTTNENQRVVDARQAAIQKACQNLQDHLKAGRLIAWGRRESPLADAKAIPRAAWSVLDFDDLQRSIVTEMTGAKTKVFDVRVYPVVHAPDAVDVLADEPLLSAFQQHVFGDPQARALRKRSRSFGGEPFDLGHMRLLYHAMWPVDFGTRREWNSILYTASRREGAEARVRSRAADRILCQCFSHLVAYLKSGALIATGVTRDGRSGIEVPRAFWERKLTYLDLENGDLIEFAPDAETLEQSFSNQIFMGLMLRRGRSSGSLFHGEPLTPDTVPSTTTLPDVAPKPKALARVGDREAAYEACVEWLADKMRASPDVRRESVEVSWTTAKERWPALSERAFYRARAVAIEMSGARAWAASGAPKKTGGNNRRT